MAETLKKQEYFIIGTMSGTSRDGLDLVYVKLSKAISWDYEILAAKTYGYSPTWFSKLGNAINLSDIKLAELNKDYSNFLADQILHFIKEFNIVKIDAVGSHGHTVIHQPDQGVTFQLGNLAMIADKINKPFICDFRIQDVLLGGQGAPLVPIGDQLLFHNYDACLNLGGFSNISIKKGNNIIAYDICALNTILNALANQINLPYDAAGAQARQGEIINPLYQELQELRYYDLLPPKSLGIEWVNAHVLVILKKYVDHNVRDLLHTYTIHSANQIAKSLNSISAVLVTGGGAFNDFLISEIKNKVSCDVIVPSANLVDFKEAIIFAFLSVLKLRGEVNCLASVTGAKYDHSSGKIFDPNT